MNANPLINEIADAVIKRLPEALIQYEPVENPYWGYKSIANFLDCEVVTAKKYAKRPDFPKAHWISKTTPLYKSNEVRDWVLKYRDKN